MKTFQKIILSLLVSFALILTPKPAYAQTVTSTPDVLNPSTQIDELTQAVTYSATNLDPAKKYSFCFEMSLDNICVPISDNSTTFNVTVCGDQDKLKTTCNPDFNNGDYFHGGSTYTAGLYEGDPKKLDKNLSFFVKHYIPDYNLLAAPGGISMTIVGKRPGGDSNNNYQLKLSGPGTNQDNNIQCVNEGETAIWGPNSTGGTLPTVFKAGDYTLDVWERVSDTGPIGIPLANCKNEGGINSAQGFHYYTINFTIDDQGNITVTQSVLDPDRKDGPPGIGAGHNPCSKTGCQTALGNIATDLSAFAKKVLAIAIGLAGGIALILMVIGSIRVLTSTGDQQKLNGGREMIIAAVVGLLFLIFSVLILQTIGIKIVGL